jgi:hypothetical protein
MIFYRAFPPEGSVGASGDLTPLSYLAAVLCGDGEVWHDGAAAAGRRSAQSSRYRALAFAPQGSARDHERHCGNDRRSRVWHMREPNIWRG